MIRATCAKGGMCEAVSRLKAEVFGAQNPNLQALAFGLSLPSGAKLPTEAVCSVALRVR